MGNSRNPYVTAVAVWIVSSFVVALLISFPISSGLLSCALLFLVLAVVGGSAYRAYRTDLKNRDLPKNLFSDLRALLMTISSDIKTVSTHVSAWWLRREAGIREELANRPQKNAVTKERRIELDRKRRKRPVEEYLTPGEHVAYKEILKNN
ncbi:MAG: hypothetical protein M3N18_01350 [Actinomycetota bacterium]|nr:hypothetical protein [Actinomycetota bacterium]